METNVPSFSFSKLQKPELMISKIFDHEFPAKKVHSTSVSVNFKSIFKN